MEQASIFAVYRSFIAYIDLALCNITQGPTDPVPEYIYTTSEPTLFSVNSDGYITVVKSDLDYENPQHRSVSMDITVRERDNPQQTASAVFSVQLLDINDNSPVFDQQRYTQSLGPGTTNRNVTQVCYRAGPV